MLDTYNIFLDRINDFFAVPHLQIQRFETGMYDQTAPFATADSAWPIMYLVPLNVIHLENSVAQYDVRVYFLDLLENDDSNERDVFSDQLSISRDFVNWLRLNSTNKFNLLNNPSSTPVKSVLMDYTAGWYLDLSIEVEEEGSDCTIPFSGTGPTPPSCPVSYVENSDGSYSVELTSGDNLILPDINILLNNTTPIEFPSVKDVSVTIANTADNLVGFQDSGIFRILDSDVDINSLSFASISAEDNLSISVINGSNNQVGSIIGSDFVISNNATYINGVQVTDQAAEEDASIAVTQGGIEVGSWDANLQEWIVPTCEDAELYLDGVLIDTIPAGDSLNLSVTLSGTPTTATYSAGTINAAMPTVYLAQEYNPLRLYALRKVNVNATRAIRIRRSSDNTEMDIGFVGDELDTATLLTFVGAGNGMVTRLYDQSVIPIDAWNTEAAKQPFIVQSGVLCTKNGKVAIRATGTQWFKINNQNGPGGPTGTIGASIRTEIVIASTSTISGGVIQYVTGYYNPIGPGGTLIGGDPSYYFGFGHYWGNSYIDSSVKNTNQVILASEYNGVSPNAKGSFFLNGTVYDDNTDVGTKTMNTYAIMGQSHSLILGIIGDWQFYMSFTNSVKSQIPAITTKLNAYYGTY